MTGSAYRASLNDGRKTYFEGERVGDLPGHPVLGRAVDKVADSYDRYHALTSGGANTFLRHPESIEELRERVYEMTSHHDVMAALTFQSRNTLRTVASKMESAYPKYAERIHAYEAVCAEGDLRIAECITDAKGDRSLAPSQQKDPDSYVRVVDRGPDGIVIRGAKLHITGASFGHELMVIPTKNMKSGDEDYAVACGIPVNAEGVRIINTTPVPRGDDLRHYPFSSRHPLPDGFVIFDDVFVPNERVFLDGEREFSSVFAHSLGLWERLGGTAFMAEQADILVGLAQLAAEMNGTIRIPHIKQKIAEMLIHATLIRGCMEAAFANSTMTPDGHISPDELYTNAAKFHAASHWGLFYKNLHDISGGATVTAPTVADLENPEVGDLAKKYMSTDGANGELRTRIFHGIRDLTADSYGAYRLLTNLQSGGGLFAQQLVSRKHFDMERAKALALREIGLTAGEAEVDA